MHAHGFGAQSPDAVLQKRSTHYSCLLVLAALHIPPPRPAPRRHADGALVPRRQPLQAALVHPAQSGGADGGKTPLLLLPPVFASPLQPALAQLGLYLEAGVGCGWPVWNTCLMLPLFSYSRSLHSGMLGPLPVQEQNGYLAAPGTEQEQWLEGPNSEMRQRLQVEIEQLRGMVSDNGVRCRCCPCCHCRCCCAAAAPAAAAAAAAAWTWAHCGRSLVGAGEVATAASFLTPAAAWKELCITQPPAHRPAPCPPCRTQYLNPAVYEATGEEAKQRRKAAAQRQKQQEKQASQDQKTQRQARQAAAAKRQVCGGEGAVVCRGEQLRAAVWCCLAQLAFIELLCQHARQACWGLALSTCHSEMQDDAYQYDSDQGRPDREQLAAAAEARLAGGAGGSQQAQQAQQQHFISSALQVR